MISFDFNEQCCGCSACANVCNVNAITMQPNTDGFLVPVVDENKCSDCGSCNKTCPYLNTRSIDCTGFSSEAFDNDKANIYFSTDEVRLHSASGGAVYDIMVKCLDEGGAVCGCAWDNDFVARHLIIRKIEDLPLLQSSKYVQSEIGDCYKQIKQLLRDNVKVVFCGTPCQTAGLHYYLGKLSESELLLTVGIICHGVPSPMVWKKYKNALEEKYHGQMIACNMRDKRAKGYQQSYTRYEFTSDISASNSRLADMSVVVQQPTYLQDPYIFLFTDNLFLRNSCYHCHYKAEHSNADIIIGDYYKSVPEADNKGCSSLIILTEKGNRAVEKLPGVKKEVAMDVVLQTMLYSSVKKHPKRESFFTDLSREHCNVINVMNSYLPLRFHVKVFLNKLGLFDLLKNIYK